MTFSDRFSSELQRGNHIGCFQRWVIGQDVIDRLPLCEQADNRSHRNTGATDAGNTTHDEVVDGDSVISHMDSLGENRRATSP